MNPEAPQHHTVQRMCPECGSHAVHRSRRRLLEHLSGYLHQHQRPYRCSACQHRYWDTRQSASRKASHAVSRPSSGSPQPKKRYRDVKQPIMQRFATWLHRKHGLTIELFITLMIVGFFVFVALWFSLGEASMF